MAEARYAMSLLVDGNLGEVVPAPVPVDDATRASASVRTRIFRDGVFGSMHRRSDGGWTVFGPSGRIELMPLMPLMPLMQAL